MKGSLVDQGPYWARTSMQTPTSNSRRGLRALCKLPSWKLTWKPKEGPIGPFKKGAIWVSMLVWGSVIAVPCQ